MRSKRLNYGGAKFRLRILAIPLLLLAALWVLLARPQMPRGRLRVELEHKARPETLRAHVEKLSIDLVPRDSDHPINLDRAAAYIEKEFTRSSANVYEQVYRYGTNEYRNIIAEFGPDNGALIVIGAHYDAEGERPGADDNASGVAGLIELTRLLSAVELRSKVLLVAFTLEEPPHFSMETMGSAVFAQSLADEGRRVNLMVCLEMIGYFSNEPKSQTFPMPILKLFYPSRGNYIAVVDQLFSSDGPKIKKLMRGVMDLPVYSINAPAKVPGVDFSDHRNFWKHDFPAVMITDTAFYRNTAYHTMDDTPDRLDYVKMAEVVNGVFYSVMELVF